MKLIVAILVRVITALGMMITIKLRTMLLSGA